jgi:hypothetical protein
MAVRQQVQTPAAPHDIRWGLQRGAIAGIVAGLVFAAFEMVVSAFMMGAGAFFMPLRMIGAIALGPETLEPSYSLLTASFAGVIVHMILSVIYGLIFGAIATVLGGPMAFVGIGTVFGFALWLINFYLIAPFAFPWFQEANPIVQFIAHTFVFGTVLGYFLWKLHERSELKIPRV